MLKPALSISLHKEILMLFLFSSSMIRSCGKSLSNTKLTSVNI
ncbi:hypothetical protein RBEAN4_1651 [Rickettsia bellii str. RML An4]|uniref:Uncharacterized protein n=1 Tax=Rickettsia bellii str. RML An4 TaxID=1359193 RepID=A0A0F3QDP2_RICBE|nr:hypothetical protein RBEAN4_1651 [Rickettsia bellii str. RML An4]